MEKEGMQIEKIGLSKERIESERLSLVPISMQYRDEIFREYSPEITAYMDPPPEDITEVEKLIEDSLRGLAEGSNLQLVILAKGSQEFFGCAGLHHIDGKTPTMGVWLKISAHGKGYGKEAMTAIKEWADKNLSYEYILFPVASENLSSRKVAESLGGKLEGGHDENGTGGLEYRIYPERK